MKLESYDTDYSLSVPKVSSLKIVLDSQDAVASAYANIIHFPKETIFERPKGAIIGRSTGAVSQSGSKWEGISFLILELSAAAVVAISFAHAYP